MSFESKIYLKGQREPLLASESQAKKVQELFIDNNVSGMQTIAVGRSAFLKENIKAVQIEADSPDGPNQRKPHYIIRHRKKNVIWKEPFWTRAAAEAELTFQRIGFTAGTKDNWQIEQM